VDEVWLDEFLNHYLSKSERDIVVLYALESRTDSEIGSILGMKEDTVKKRRQRLFSKLKELAAQGLLPLDTAFPGKRESFVSAATRTNGGNRLLATILFEDIADSTETAMQMGDRRWTSVLARHQADISDVLARHQGKLIKTTGDGVLAIFDGPARAVHAAHAIREAGLRVGLKTRSGIHTGEIELTPNDIAGISVHIAARTVQCTPKNEIWATRTVKDTCVGAGIGFEHMGSHAFKGLPDSWELYRTVTV
jgi:class 3 adenylate cyclase